MRDSMLFLMMLTLVISALSQVYVRHQHRIAYAELTREQGQRDALTDEWYQLLTEERSEGAQYSIENRALKSLRMRLPAVNEIEVIRQDSVGLVLNQKGEG